MVQSVPSRRSILPDVHLRVALGHWTETTKTDLVRHALSVWNEQ